MQIGIQLPEVEWEVPFDELIVMAKAAESVGFDSLWLGDHLLYDLDVGARGPWEVWTSLAAIAASTTTIELGPLVASTSFHAPAMLAKQAATVDAISGGRLILGLGAGWNRREYDAFGFPYDHRVSRFAEAFTIVRTLLRDGRIDFAGRFHTLRDCELLPRGPRAGGPPLMVGSIGPRMLRITMPHVAAWNAWFNYYGNRPEGIPAVRTLVDDACREVGRDPADVERSVAVFLALEERPVIRDFERETSEPVRGTPEQVADTLRAFAAQGIAEVQLVIDPITASGIERLAPILEQLDRPG